MDPAARDEDFAELLRWSRSDAGLTQEELAERAGVGVRSLQRLESGEARPRRDTLKRLLQALAVSGELRAALEAAARGKGTRPSQTAGEPAGMLVAARPPLPVPATSLIGREEEREALRQQLLHAEGRLLALTGVGGVGKTRLALDLATDLQSAFPDGVVWVEFAPLADAALVPGAVAAAAGVVPPSGVPVPEALAAAWHERGPLVVLDNCEHLLGACARLSADLLTRCSRLRILATSREPLQVAGEQQWRVPPLPAPDPERMPAFRDLARSPAVRLFVERAQAVAPAFALTERDGPAVARVCARLDGLPLALELAAALTRLLTVEQIEERLDQRFRLLAGGSRTAPTRQQTLRATMDWSYVHLDPPARELFASLSVFVGGFTLEAAEAVGADEGVSDAVLSLLAHLVDASLVVAEVAPDRGGRFHLLETLRAYARERLETEGDLQDARARHAAFYLQLTEQRPSQMLGSDQAASPITRLVPERHNLLAALDWYREQAQPEAELRIGRALASVWYNLGLFATGLAQLAALIELARTIPPSGDAARLLERAGGFAQQRGDYPTARALVEEALAIARRLDDPPLLAEVLGVLGPIAREQGDLAASRSALEEALAILLEPAGNHGEAAHVLIRLGEVAHVEGNFAEAQRYYEAGVALRDELGIGYPRASHCLGIVALDRGDFVAARHWIVDCLRRQVDGRERTWLHSTLADLACLAAAEGRPELALYLAGAMEAQCERTGAALQPTERPRFEIWLDQARRTVDSEAARAALARGRATPIENVIAEVLAMPSAQATLAATPPADEGQRANARPWAESRHVATFGLPSRRRWRRTRPGAGQ